MSLSGISAFRVVDLATRPNAEAAQWEWMDTRVPNPFYKPTPSSEWAVQNEED